MGEKMTEAQWQARHDLRQHWHAFCDCDPFPGREDFAERMDAAGLIGLRSVTKRDLEEDPFAAERGIEKGGLLWDLTAAGRRALAGKEG